MNGTSSVTMWFWSGFGKAGRMTLYLLLFGTIALNAVLLGMQWDDPRISRFIGNYFFPELYAPLTRRDKVPVPGHLKDGLALRLDVDPAETSDDILVRPMKVGDNADALLQQLSMTYPTYDASFLARSEQKYYNRPEIPFVLEFLEITSGQSLADIGCGVGAYTFPIARALGTTGRLYAIDVQAAAIEVVNEHARSKLLNPFDNIITFVNAPDDAKLPPRSIDTIWLSQVHFHNGPLLMEENIRMIKSMYTALKPGGILAIGDESIVPEHVPDTIVRHYTTYGFVLVEGPFYNTNPKTTFYLKFRKPGP